MRTILLYLHHIDCSVFVGSMKEFCFMMPVKCLNIGLVGHRRLPQVAIWQMFDLFNSTQCWSRFWLEYQQTYSWRKGFAQFFLWSSLNRIPFAAAVPERHIKTGVFAGYSRLRIAMHSLKDGRYLQQCCCWQLRRSTGGRLPFGNEAASAYAFPINISCCYSLCWTRLDNRREQALKY